ncbi:hypothetical protein D3C74_390850 [compost metagenome]
MRWCVLVGLVWMTLMTSWAVSRKPRPLRPPTSTNDAKRDHTTQVSAWSRVHELIIVFMPSWGVRMRSLSCLAFQ